VRTAIDSSVLILLARKQDTWKSWSTCLGAAALEGELVICPVVFAEFSLAYPSADQALEDLRRLHIEYSPFHPDSAHLAGSVFLRYRRDGGPRERLVPDFLIAAHATMQADRLAAIDRGYLRRYFPTLRMLQPKG
jgi:predicted nucleic acid-binding protein